MVLWRRFASFLVCVTTLFGLAPLRPGQPVSTIAQELGAKIWVGRHQEIEEYLRTAECVSMQVFATSGVMRCTLRPGGLVARMAWRSGPPGIYRGFWASYKAEIAAYELDKLLKLNMLPPTVEREFQGNKGSGVLWVENIVDSKGASPDESNRVGWEKQLVQMRMFDNLTGNPVRNTGNMLHDAAWNLILLDHSRAFRPDADLLHRLSRIDADLWDKVRALTRTQLDARLGLWLDDNEISAIIDRRERMKAEIDRLIGARGAGAVFLR
jgi:hypothetical protein